MRRTLLAIALCAMQLTVCSAQKQFTLEDLNFGGTNYRQMSPKTLRLWWDGNILVTDEDKQHPVSYPKVFSRDNNIYVQMSAESEPIQVTKDGNRQLVYGDAVHRNEFGINGGIFWSPNRNKLACILPYGSVHGN